MAKLMLAILVDDKAEYRFDKNGAYDSTAIINKLQSIQELEVIMMWTVNPGREVLELNKLEDWPLEIKE
jgi:hypothetical protein